MLTEIHRQAAESAIIRLATVARMGTEEYGLTVGIHAHAAGFIDFEPELERLLDEIPEETLKICFDTGHHSYAGFDPVAFMRRHIDRIIANAMAGHDFQLRRQGDRLGRHGLGADHHGLGLAHVRQVGFHRDLFDEREGHALRLWVVVQIQVVEYPRAELLLVAAQLLEVEREDELEADPAAEQRHRGG